MYFKSIFSPIMGLFLAPLLVCSSAMSKELPHPIIQAKIADLKPGQTSAGFKEVEIKLDHFLSEFDLTLKDYLQLRRQDPSGKQMRDILSSAHFENFLSARNIQVIRDPLGELHIVDGHHLALSLYRLHIEWADVELYQDFLPSSIRLTPSEREAAMRKFERYMIENGFVRLRDADGDSLKMSDLPDNIADLEDDPFRSLAWLLKKSGLYEDEGIPFQEFGWSEFLRKEFLLRGWKVNFSSSSEFMTAVNRALEIADENKDILQELSGGSKFLEKPKQIRRTCERLLSRRAQQ